MMPVTEDRFRMALRQHATTVTVVTAPGERPAGFTATSFTSVSLRPPLISFCLGRASSSWPVIASARHVGIHLLSTDQREIAQTFAARGHDRFATVAWRPGPYGVPLLPGVLAWLVCRVVTRQTAGDHAVVLAEPLVAEWSSGTPLLYHDGHYTDLATPYSTAEGGRQ